MTLETMSNIRLGTECRDTLQEDYKKFLAGNKKTVVLDVEPANHVIERCFRLFSYYERKAVYDREDRRYRLEIVYYSYDEAEVVRDILSLGSSVIVLEPAELRNKIYERILAANELYTC
jgi:predicted DNA-binding transcriptional regulator YafY